jgi:hypothetical protein
MFDTNGTKFLRFPKLPAFKRLEALKKMGFLKQELLSIT